MAFELRPFQKLAIDTLTTSSSAHVICVAPTGSGKSLIYETISALPRHRTLLVSPLVALARQQAERLKKLGIVVKVAAGGNSEGPPFESDGAWIVSPESLQFSSRKQALAQWQPNFLVLDECHCLWEWGESFRPAFNTIPPLLNELNIQQSLWLTATLPFAARRQLRECLPGPPVEMGSFALPQRLKVHIEQVPWESRASRLLKWVRERDTFGIIFVSTREDTLRLARLLEAVGKKVVQYHAGLSIEERRNVEKQVLDQVPEVIVATSAFGMGMDYPHLRYVVLWQAPPSLLSLVQTMGRVGRGESKDGEALVLWDLEDFRLLEWTLQKSDRRRSDLLEVMDYLMTRRCRLIGLKRYFDRIADQDCCGKCDVCLSAEFI